jgi:hypothetical protein
MKYFLLLGGFCGFTMAFIGGLAVGHDLSVVLRDATIGCLGGATLMRGFRIVMNFQLRQLMARREREQSTPEPSCVATQA